MNFDYGIDMGDGDGADEVADADADVDMMGVVGTDEEIALTVEGDALRQLEVEAVPVVASSSSSSSSSLSSS